MISEEVKLIVANGAVGLANVSGANEITNTISVVCSVVASIVTIAYVIYKWYKRAKADGKITKEEVDELIDKVGEEIDKHKH